MRRGGIGVVRRRCGPGAYVNSRVEMLESSLQFPVAFLTNSLPGTAASLPATKAWRRAGVAGAQCKRGGAQHCSGAGAGPQKFAETPR